MSIDPYSADAACAAELSPSAPAWLIAEPTLSGSPTPNLSEPPLTVPGRIGRYHVERVLGAGGFGCVYLGHDEELDRQVAIKVPHAARLAEDLDRDSFICEARALARLDHSNIVPVYDVGRVPDDVCYVVSKYIDGSNLAQLLKVGRPTITEAVKLVVSIAEALHYAHRKGVVHRDIKPSNILIGKDDRPYVADFGLALRDEDFGTGARLVGTPAYMSPEQARGAGHRVDGRSDIFSLGIVFYEILTGRKPFRGADSEEVLQQIIEVEARPPRMIDDEIPEKLERICLKALAKDVSARYTTAKDFADHLKRYLAGIGVQETSLGESLSHHHLFRLATKLESSADGKTLLVDAGFFRARLKCVGEPTAPIFCGCASARLSARFDGGESASDPVFPNLPNNTQARVEYGIGAEPSVRLEAQGPARMLEGRARIAFPRMLMKDERLGVAVAIEPEWFSIDGPGATPLDSAAKVVIDSILRRLLHRMKKRFTL